MDEPNGMPLAERVNRVISWALSFLIVIPLFMVLMRLLNRTRIRGKHHLQNAPLPLMFVSNHVTILDDGLVDTLVFPPRAVWEYDFLPYHVPEERNFFRGAALSWFMRRMKCIPIRRGEGVFQPAVARVIEALRAGGCVRIFPEGTRTRSGGLRHGRPGVGRVLYETGVTVVPCHHRGMEKILPIGSRFPRIGQHAEISIGAPFRIDDFRSLPNTPETWQKISDHLMQRIADLQ